MILIVYVHASLVNEQLCISGALVEMVVKMEFDTCPTLKIENENLNGQLAQVMSLSNVVSTSSSDRGNVW